MVTGIAAAVATIMVGLITYLGNRKRSNISGAQEITDAALALVTPQVTRIQDLQQELNECYENGAQARRACRSQKVKLRTRVYQLEAQLVRLGHDPEPPPTQEGT